MRSLIWQVLQYLIELFVRLFRKERSEEKEKKEEEPQRFFTRDEFKEVVMVLSADPAWRARMLLDALASLRNERRPVMKWVSKGEITMQVMDAGQSCGVMYSFGEGAMVMAKEDWEWLIDNLRQDAIKYVEEMTDCDNFAIFFKGFADYVLGEEAVIYVTGIVGRESVYGLGGQTHRACVCRRDVVIGGHAWNRILVMEPVQVSVVDYDFRVYDYEPQSDEVGVGKIGNWCYWSGGGLPVFYCRKPLYGNPPNNDG